MRSLKTHIWDYSETRRRSAVLYTARFPAAFLDRFDQPSRYFPSDPVIISYCRIPVAPTEDMFRAIKEAMFPVINDGQRKEMERPSEDKLEKP